MMLSSKDLNVVCDWSLIIGHKLKFNFQNPENRKTFEEVVFDHDQYSAAVTDDDQVFQEFGILEDTVVAFKKVAFWICQWRFICLFF